ncbi:MAG: hypothetical protein QOE28_2997 [Solirubrobacteraceae bacterium]|nr:hypothetical protein [Solirubrobacteraceae bacterium]
MLLFAHGIVGRADLPIPETLFGAAAAAVLVVSFLALGAGWSKPRLETIRERSLFRLPLAVDIVLGAVGVVAFAVTVYAGLAGTSSQQDNLTPTAVFVAFWVGVPFVSLLFGDVWRLLSPWRAVGRLVGWTASKVSGGMPEPLEYPARLGNWPVVVGIVGFVICELCWATGREPLPLAIMMVVYALAQGLGMSLYGVEAWTRRGDAFGVWFGLISLLAPIGRRPDGRLVLRPPVAGATRMPVLAGTVALLICGIASTGFDGAKEGPLFASLAQDIQDGFFSIGIAKGLGLELAFVVGLAIAISLVGGLWRAGVEGMPRTGLELDRAGVSRRFGHALVPIAAGYLVAHYFSLLAYNGQDVWRLASDPLGRGSDLFGGAGAAIDYGVVSATAIWYVQVLALVGGHVAALVLAHDQALVTYGSAKAAARSQVVMLVLMVCFTCLGLWLLSAALNT